MKQWWHKHWLSVVTGALFVVTVVRLGLVPELPAVLAFVFGGALLAVIDWRIQRLPTRLVYQTLAAVGAGLVFAAAVERDVVPLATALLGAVLFVNAFFLIWLVTTRTFGLTVLGLGDVRLAALLGLVLGWYGLPYVLAGAAVGHVLALAVTVGTCVRRGGIQFRYSFGPPLIAGALAVVLVQA